MKNIIQIGIFGLGAIGSLIAKYIHLNESHEIYYFTRTPKSRVTISFYNSITYIETPNQRIDTFNHKLDWLFVCLKAHHFESAHEAFKKLISPTTNIVIIRNGLDLEADLFPYTMAEKILPCLIYCSIEPSFDNTYLQFESPKIITKEGSISKDLKDLFSSDEISILTTQDFKTSSWKKLIESACIGALQCKYNAPSIIFRNNAVLDECKKLIKEAVDVSLADGANIDSEFEIKLLTKISRLPDNKGSSMLTDFRNGNQIELKAKNGAIVKIGEKYRITTPLHSHICDILS